MLDVEYRNRFSVSSIVHGTWYANYAVSYAVSYAISYIEMVRTSYVLRTYMVHRAVLYGTWYVHRAYGLET